MALPQPHRPISMDTLHLRIPPEIIVKHIFPELPPRQVQELCKAKVYRWIFPTYLPLLREKFATFSLSTFLSNLNIHYESSILEQPDDWEDLIDKLGQDLRKDKEQEQEIFREAFESYCGSAHLDVEVMFLDDIRDFLLTDTNLASERKLLVAAYYGLVRETARILREWEHRPNLGIGPTYQKSYALRLASEHNHVGVLSVLLEDGRSDPNVMEGRAMEMAIRNGSVAALQCLLKDGRADFAPLRQFFELQQILKTETPHFLEIVQILLKDVRIDPDRDCDVIFSAAITVKNIPIAKCLLEDGRLDPSKHGCFYVHVANCIPENEKMVQLLVKDPRVQEARKRGKTFADVLDKRETIAKFFLEHIGEERHKEEDFFKNVLTRVLEEK